MDKKTKKDENSQLTIQLLTLEMGILGIKEIKWLAHDYNEYVYKW